MLFSPFFFFLKNFLSQSSKSVDDLMDYFYSQMLDIMENIAPWKLNSTVKLLKRECRKTERQWRKTKLPVHYNVYKENLKTLILKLVKLDSRYFLTLSIITLEFD